MHVRSRISALLALLVLASCEYNFQMESTASPLLYVQCVPRDGNTAIQVRYAAPAAGKVDIPAAFQPSAVVLNINGTAQPLTEDEQSRILHCNTALRPGDKVSVQVSGNGLPDAAGESTVPPVPFIQDISWEKVQADTILATRVTLILDHAPTREEYHGIQIFCRTFSLWQDEDGRTWTDESERYIAPGRSLTPLRSGTLDFEDYVQLNFQDGLVSGSVSGKPGEEPLTLLAADQFDGAQYIFYINSADLDLLYAFAGRALPGESGWGEIDWNKISEGSEHQPGSASTEEKEEEDDDDEGWPRLLYELTQYQIILYRFSSEFYYYAKAQYQSNFDFLSNMGLTPANFTWSNISGGLGAIGAVSSVRSEPFIPDPIPDILNP